MYYSTKTGQRVEELPEDSTGWIELPEEYDWRYWTFDDEHYRPKTEDELIQEDLNKKSELTRLLWNSINEFADSQMDTNSRHSINLYLTDPNLSENKRSKIIEYAMWWASLWDYYETKKLQIINGEEVYFDLSELNNCPYTIWQIKEA
jgi:hypothetical protein